MAVFREIPAVNLGNVNRLPRIKVCDGALKRTWLEPATGEARWHTVVPEALRDQDLVLRHGLPGVGHFGVTKTLKRVQQSFYWGQCRRDVEDHCHRCDPCAARKGP
ncbi:hypothetical protein N1851_034320 [Merluccius polli]|uniref:Gypsy retrotransposon integrase-like protein 1 n=1 Tax=Merluccius polli TaxID=89951 RepID=A0AA47NLI3_MERPO|nr:hypothetical protein N1851_034320 [Merluccius polli]